MNDEFMNNEAMNKETAADPETETSVQEEAPDTAEAADSAESPVTETIPEDPSLSPSYDHYYYGAAPETANAQEPVSSAPAKKQHKNRTWGKALKLIAGAACFGLIAGAAFVGVSYLGGNLLQINGLASDNQGSQSTGGNGTQLNITLSTTGTIQAEAADTNVVVQVVEQNLAATVAVKNTYVQTSSFFGQHYQKEYQASGSGFIVGMNDTELLIATNNHVIANAVKIEITFIDDTVLEATVKGTDEIADLAIIAVPLETISADTLSSIRIATLGNSEDVRLGEMAIAIGNALGYGQSVTVGYISAKDREVTVDGNTMILLQTDAAINGGNSGGPLFNDRGEVIGINSVKYADTEVEGMCFAIPISRAIPILSELMTRETLEEDEKGALGITTTTVSGDIASLYGWPTGAYITAVSEGSPAEEAKLYVGDIVTSVNGVTITTSDQLVSAVSSYRYGTTIEIKVQRNISGKYQEVTISATLGQRSVLIGTTEK